MILLFAYGSGNLCIGRQSSKFCKANKVEFVSLDCCDFINQLSQFNIFKVGHYKSFGILKGINNGEAFIFIKIMQYRD